jgi:ligand-binding sensor domain-containing protein
VDVGVPLEEFGVYAVASDRAGSLYVGLEHGLSIGVRASGGGCRFRALRGVSEVPVSGLYVEDGGAVWFGCGLRICRYDNDSLSVFGKAEGVPADRWRTVLRDGAGNLWIRGVRRLFVRPAGEERFVARDQGLPQTSNDTGALAIDHDGTLLAGTDLGLARLIGVRWELITTVQGLESDTITAIYHDREGSLWLGIWGNGAAQWIGYGEWSAWTKADGLSNNIIWAVRRYPSGMLRVGTDRGITRFREGGRPQILTERTGSPGTKSRRSSSIDEKWSGPVLCRAACPGSTLRPDASGSSARSPVLPTIA